MTDDARCPICRAPLPRHYPPCAVTYADINRPHDIIGRAMSARHVFHNGWSGFVAHAVIDEHRHVWLSTLCWKVWHWPSRRVRVAWWRLFELGEAPVT